MTTRKALLLVNVGTPDRPEKRAVRNYLFQFLNDSRVIDIPWLSRKILVNLIIVPFRAGKSTKLYQKLWTDRGSPLLVYMNDLAGKLQERLGKHFEVWEAMRYGKPSLEKQLENIRERGYDEVVIFPLFPQYASSTTGSVVERVMRITSRWNVIPAIRFVDQYYDAPAFIDAFAQRIRSYHPENYDRVIFSYHGLPIRQIEKVHPQVSEPHCSCVKQMPEHGTHCYKATCYETTRLLAKKLNLNDEKFLTTFQSRLSKNWLYPFTDETVKELARQGTKKVLVVAPSFVTDCLETIIELGEENREIFMENGGEVFDMVESLNADERWADAIVKILGQ